MVTDNSPETCPRVRIATLCRKLWYDPRETWRVCLWSGLDDELYPTQETTRFKEAVIGLVHCPVARSELTDQVGILGAGDSAGGGCSRSRRGCSWASRRSVGPGLDAWYGVCNPGPW